MPHSLPSAKAHLGAIEPKVPARLLCGPAVKNNLFIAPFVELPPPKSIAHNWSITIAWPVDSLTTPEMWPVAALKALIVPLFVLLEISRVLLSGPKFEGATGSPQGWFNGAP